MTGAIKEEPKLREPIHEKDTYTGWRRKRDVGKLRDKKKKKGILDWILK